MQLTKAGKQLLMNRYRTSEYVGIGHPDKVADQISDTILDFYLRLDPNARVAAETLVSGNKVIVAGEISANTMLPPLTEDLKSVIRETLRDIGYGNVPGEFNADDVEIEIYLKAQSKNINAGVNKKDGDVGAGDQGIMFGYAINETEYYLPLPYVISAELLNRLNKLILTGELEGFYTDNKSQTCVKYVEHDGISIPDKFIEKIILSCWHKESLELEDLRVILWENVVDPILMKYSGYIGAEMPEVFINSAGPFYIGGPVADAGLTGRKIIVDTYGGFAPHGGGAFSGKDPSKVDRSAAYMARHVAKSLVVNGYAYEALVQLSYAIGHTQPFSVDITADSELSEEELVQLVRDNFDLSPRGIIEYLKLNDPNSVKYKTVASGGHFLDPTATWEQVKKF